MAQVRYIVHDVEESVSFYTSQLGFELEQQYGPAMAILGKDDLKLWLAGPPASASQPMPDGSEPQPGGWCRIVLTVPELASVVERLRDANVRFRNEIIEGPGGNQILCEDPSGNAIELFEPS